MIAPEGLFTIVFEGGGRGESAARRAVPNNILRPIRSVVIDFISLPNALDQTFRAVAHKAAPPRLCHRTKLSGTLGSAHFCFSFFVIKREADSSAKAESQV